MDSILNSGIILKTFTHDLASNGNPDQTDPLGAVFSGFIALLP